MRLWENEAHSEIGPPEKGSRRIFGRAERVLDEAISAMQDSGGNLQIWEWTANVLYGRVQSGLTNMTKSGWELRSGLEQMRPLEL